MKMEKNKDNRLVIIVKIEKYIEYMLTILLKLPRTEKFSIGTEYKQSMYKLLENVIYLNKLEKEERLIIINKIDAELNIQRIFLRIMYKSAWIDKKKFDIAIDYIFEIGKIVGGLIKYYGKNNKKWIW